jgi:hypothetical protein
MSGASSIPAHVIKGLTNCSNGYGGMLESCTIESSLESCFMVADILGVSLLAIAAKSSLNCPEGKGVESLDKLGSKELKRDSVILRVAASTPCTSSSVLKVFFLPSFLILRLD